MSAPFDADEIIFSLAIAPDTRPTKSGLCLAGCRSGLYRSLDGGQSWQNLYDRLQLQALVPTTAVLFSPQFTQDHTIFAGVGANIFRSQDGGEHWQGVSIASPLPAVSCMAISADFLRDGTLFAGTVEDGLFQSSDRGEHWKPVNFALLDLNILSLAVAPRFPEEALIFAGVESGLFRSKNGARAWRETSLPVGYEPVFGLVISPDGRVFAGTETKGLLVSTDQGKTWDLLPGDPPPGAVICLYILPDSALVALLDTGLYLRSETGSWRPWNEQHFVGEISAAALLERDEIFLAGCLGGDMYWLPKG